MAVFLRVTFNGIRHKIPSTYIEKIIFPNIVELFAPAQLCELNQTFVDFRAESPTAFRRQILFALLVHESVGDVGFS